MNWIILYFEALLTCVALFLMGALLLLAVGSTNIKRILIASPLVALAFLGLLSLVSCVIPWSLLSVVASLALLVAVVVGVRFLQTRLKCSRSFAEQKQALVDQAKHFFVTKEFIGAALGVFAASLIAVSMMSGLSLSSPIGLNEYDNPFHYSVVRHILETGNASPIGAGSVMGSAHAIYPDLWHAITALLVATFNQTIVIAGWITCLVFFGFIAPAGIAALVLTLFKTYAAELAFVTPIISLVVPLSSFRFLVGGCLFANLAGLELLPLSFNFFIDLTNEYFQAKKTAKHRQTLRALIGGSLVAIFALGFAHPSAVIIFCLIALPFIVEKLPNLVSKCAVCVVLVIGWLLLQMSPLFYRTVNCIDRVYRGEEVAEWLFSRLGLDYATLANLSWLPCLVFAMLVICAAIVAYALKNKWRYSWYLVSIALVVGITFSIFFPTNWFSILVSGYFYRDIARLIVFSNFLALPLYTAIPALILHCINTRTTHVVRGVLVVVFAVVCMGCVVFFVKDLIDFRETKAVHATKIALTSAQAEYLENVARIVGDDVVLNNNNDDSCWLYPIFGTRALLKGHPGNQMSSMSEDYCMLIENIGAYGMDNEASKRAQDAVRKLDVKYVTKMTDFGITTTRFNELSQIDHESCDSICSVTEQTPGFELVYELDGMQLFRLRDA